MVVGVALVLVSGLAGIAFAGGCETESVPVEITSDDEGYLPLDALLQKLNLGDEYIIQGETEGDIVSVSSPMEFLRDGNYIIVTGAIASKVGHIGKITVSGWFGTRRAKLYIGRDDEGNINGKWMARVPAREMRDNVTVKVDW